MYYSNIIGGPACTQMEYGVRAREVLSGDTSVGPGSVAQVPGLPANWLQETSPTALFGSSLLAAAYHQLPASSAALLLSSLQTFQSSADGKPNRSPSPGHASAEDPPRRPEQPDDEQQEDQANERLKVDEDETSFESWRDTTIPVLSSWMLSAYATMLGRLSAATAAFEAAAAAEDSNFASDSDSESDRSTSTDVLSRESSPSIGGSAHQMQEKPNSGVVATSTRTKTKKRRTTDKSRKSIDTAAKEKTGAADASDAPNKRSLALQRVRYEREEYRCSLCPYACTIEKAFQRHLRAHARGTASETRVSCAVCGADRSSEVDLSRHMRRHRDNRYFCCDICVFRTVQLKKLIQHRRMHTGEKPHLCPHCCYRSARRDNLRSHVRRVHKKENLYCDTFSPRGVFIVPKLEQRQPEGDEQLVEIEEESASPASPPSVTRS